MIEKENRGTGHDDPAAWSERRLNEHIMALYEQIERATLDNLEIARKNSELEIQIETIDDVIRTHPQRKTAHRPPSAPSEHDGNYGALLSEHLALAERVAKIEELLAGGEKRGVAVRDNQSTLQKITSIQDLARGKKGTVEKGRERRGEGTNREDTARKSKYA